jgi:predicted P-loop ATPase
MPVEKVVPISPAIDRRITITRFPNKYAQKKREYVIRFRSLVPVIEKRTAAKKTLLPFMKLATFGDEKSAAGCYRTDANMKTIDGIEVDYDAGEITIDEAIELARAANIAAIFYTSASHTPEKPRWRGLCPTSRTLPKEERKELVARLNRVLKGALARESFVDSQSYYFGRIEGDPNFRCEIVDGRGIDQAGELEPLHKSGQKGKPNGGEATDDGLDPTRSGRAWRLGIRILARGGGKRDIIKALNDDEDLAAWAEETPNGHNANHMWENLIEQYGWMYEWTRNKSGMPISNLDNAVHALRHARDLKDILAYDQMLRAEILMKPVPGSDEQWQGHRPLKDVDVSGIQEFLQDKWMSSLSKDTTHQAVQLRASESPFHPVREYLKKVTWDGVERLPTWLSVYLGAEQTPYTVAIGKMFLISMVARIFKPGCQVDYMLILEDETQGEYKSTALSVLGGDWFSDSLPNVRHGDKDVSQHLNGKWLIEVSEMSAMSKADAEALKSFLTRRVEQYRPSYGRKDVYEPRQCVFTGTTNKTAYLRDETGNRRFWPVKTGKIDLGSLRRDRDQLFAEAVVRYQRGEQWWPDREFEAEHIRPEQDARYLEDDWTETVREYLDGHKTGRVTTKEIAVEALYFDEKSITDQITQRIAKILSRLGCKSKRTKSHRYWIDVV